MPGKNGKNSTAGKGRLTSQVELGYALSSEEHAPNDLVRFARRAEESGFQFALISDHFHPWLEQQGHSSFVWSVLGAIAHRTGRLRVGTGVTCPLFRIHPAIIAQAAATVASMMPGRFFLGVGTGENLNEHILGDKWPPSDVRRERLNEAVRIIRLLWEGGSKSYYGDYYQVENAQIFTLPEQTPEIYVAAGGENAAALAGKIGDGLISTSPDRSLVETFAAAGGKKKPRYGMLTVCYAADEKQAQKTAYKWWRNTAVPGELSQELPLPAHFEQASESIPPEKVCESMTCGPDPQLHARAIQKYIDAGFTHIYVHQVGPDQEGFFAFYEAEVLPRFQNVLA